jgi:hypothetical protein
MDRHVITVIGMTALLLTSRVWAADLVVPAANVTMTAGATNGTIDDAIRDIEQARTLPQAVSPYARALTFDRGNARLYQAYIRRLVELDLPDLAVAPAHVLASLEPDNALALAVLAIDAAQHADMRTAVTDVVIAGTRNPDEPFVQHAAAEVLAWYDTAADRSMVPMSIVTSLEALRPQIQSKLFFVDTYRQAVQAYQDQAAAAKPQASPASQPATPDTHTPVASPVPAAPAPLPQVVDNYYYFNSPAYYPSDVGYPGYPGYADYAGYSYGYSYPWPGFGIGYGFGGYHHGYHFGGRYWGGNHPGGVHPGGSRPGANHSGGSHAGGHR